jgi:hypothetical protein
MTTPRLSHNTIYKLTAHYLGFAGHAPLENFDPEDLEYYGSRPWEYRIDPLNLWLRQLWELSQERIVAAKARQALEKLKWDNEQITRDELKKLGFNNHSIDQLLLSPEGNAFIAQTLARSKSVEIPLVKLIQPE